MRYVPALKGQKATAKAEKGQAGFAHIGLLVILAMSGGMYGAESFNSMTREERKQFCNYDENCINGDLSAWFYSWFR